MSLALLFHYLMLNMFQMLIQGGSNMTGNDLCVNKPHLVPVIFEPPGASIFSSLRLISWVVLLWFDVCWCYVVVWLWWCGIRMQAEALVLDVFKHIW